MAKLPWLRFLGYSAFRNLWRAPRRTLISLSAIAAATASLVLFLSFVNGVKAAFRHDVIHSAYGHYQIFTKGFRDGKDEDAYAYQIDVDQSLKTAIQDEVGPVAFMSRRLSFYGLLTAGERSAGGRGMGIDAEEEAKFLNMTQVVSGKPLAQSPEQSIYVGVGLAKRLGLKPGDPLTVMATTAKGSINAMDFDVVGIFKSGIRELDDNVYFVHFPVAEKILRVKGAQVLVLGFQGDDELTYRPALERLVAKRFPKLEVVHWHALADFFDTTMGWLERMFGVVRLIILLVATLSIINVFMMSLFERLGEFGTLRAIGTYRAEIASMIFTESLLQSVLGGLAGAALAVFVIKVGLGRGVVMPPPPLMSVPFHVQFAVPWRELPATLALIILSAGGAGIYPAIRMARVGVVEALGRNV